MKTSAERGTVAPAIRPWPRRRAATRVASTVALTLATVGVLLAQRSTFEPDNAPHAAPLVGSAVAPDPTVRGEEAAPGGTSGGAERPSSERPPSAEGSRPSVVAAGTIVAAADGTAEAAGTLADPLDLRTALAVSSPLRPGGTLVLKGGVYRGSFESRVSGTPSQPITIRSAPGEWATFDGGSSRRPALTVYGADSWFRDFEVTKTDIDRSSSQTGSHPNDLARGTAGDPYTSGAGIYVFGPRTKLVDLVVHDASGGIGLWRWGADDAEVYGCIVYNNGWSAPDRGHGHGIYTQNDSGTKTISDTIVFNNFGFGVHAYDVSTDINGYDLERVVSFENGAPSGAHQPNIFVGTTSGRSDRISLSDSVAYHRPSARADNVRLGFDSDANRSSNGTVRVTGNTIIGGLNGLVVQGWNRGTITGNEIVTARDVPDDTDLVKLLIARTTASVSPFAAYTWDDNSYVDGALRAGVSPSSFETYDAVTRTDTKRYTYAGWRSLTKLDQHSVYTNESEPAVSIDVHPNRFQRGRAFVVVRNASGMDHVALDLHATGLRRGEHFEVLDVQDLPGGPVLEAVYRGSSVSLPTTNTGVAQPIGGSRVRITHTPPDFNVFLVVPVEE